MTNTTETLASKGTFITHSSRISRKVGRTDANWRFPTHARCIDLLIIFLVPILYSLSGNRWQKSL